MRFVYINCRYLAGFEMDNWKDSDEAFHLCHKRGCYNPEHLVLEDSGINKERDTEIEAWQPYWIRDARQGQFAAKKKTTMMRKKDDAEEFRR